MRKIAYIVGSTLLSTTLAVQAESRIAQMDNQVSGPITVEVLSVHDGDTFTALAHMWPEQYVKTHVRVAGVDTPETRGRCPQERELALEAKTVAENFLIQGAPISIRNVRLDKYGGRVDADVFDAQGRSLAATLVAAKLARAYDGGTKQAWCP
ncbi:thermonuclease family protein [bacterium]|nr:thermonuclease family protein [bacterium]